MSLRAAIEGVYDAFSEVEKPLGIDGCPCCMTPDEYETLTAKPLRELSSVELNEFAFDALLTMGSEDDYQYFLPRILEDDLEWDTSIEITANKMQMARFQQWNEKKKAAINNLWLTVIREVATTGSDLEPIGLILSDIDSWLGAATLIPIPVSPLTDVLDGFPDVVRTLYNDNFETLFQGRLDNAFLHEPSEGQTEIANWLRYSVEKTMK